MSKGVIEISPGRIRALAADPAGGTDSGPAAPSLESDQHFAPFEVTPARLGELIERAAGEVRSVSGGDPEVVVVGKLGGSRLPAMVERLARRAGLGPVRVPSRREQVIGAFLAATGSESGRSSSREAVLFPTDSFLGLAVGDPGRRPDWTASRPVTAAGLVRRARFGDPPSGSQLEAATSATLRHLESLEPPGFTRTLLVSEMTPQVARLCGTEIDFESAGRALDRLCDPTGTSAVPAESSGLAQRQALAATLVICKALSFRFDTQLELMVPDPARAWAMLSSSDSVEGPRRDS